MKIFCTILGLFILISQCLIGSEVNAKPVKVFILAGQSNMEGQGFISSEAKRNQGKGSLEFLAKDTGTKARFSHLLNKDGQWIMRDDVFISYLDKNGPLTVGYGATKEKIGPELGFGTIVGNAFEQPVLLIKCAWGGKSLAIDFRPPSSAKPPYPLNKKTQDDIDKNPEILGKYYRETLSLTKSALKNIKQLVPDSDGSYELAGFAWHQGWNDRISDQYNGEYEKNMVNFIKDIRKDLNAPKLPFVIGETGMTGPTEIHPRALSLMKSQENAATLAEFQGNVVFVPTKTFWREKELSPNSQGYHWNCNAETYYLIGEAMGQAILKLKSTK